jgi:hypothetical protein
MFGGEGRFEDRICSLVSALAGGLPVSTAVGPGGRLCPFASVRVLTPGAEIGVHVGNEFAQVAQAEHFRATMDLSDQLSWFVPLTVPEGGGELVVYGVEWDDVRSQVPEREGHGTPHVWLEGSKAADAVRSFPCTSFAPEVGDLLVFDGGRYFHRVSRVSGGTPRRTIGGFLGFSHGHDRVFVGT